LPSAAGVHSGVYLWRLRLGGAWTTACHAPLAPGRSAWSLCHAARPPPRSSGGRGCLSALKASRRNPFSVGPVRPFQHGRVRARSPRAAWGPGCLLPPPRIAGGAAAPTHQRRSQALWAAWPVHHVQGDPDPLGPCRVGIARPISASAAKVAVGANSAGGGMWGSDRPRRCWGTPRGAEANRSWPEVDAPAQPRPLS
jgi:hypothetical protein